jgi:D-psicose/D-tagatose/L-ribulose 3-epimerase
MAYEFRHSICNEVFEGWSFADAAKAIRKAGYQGIEISPFTLSSDPASISAAQRRQYRGIIESEGLVFAGLHWLLVSPKGLHVTTPDQALRERSWEYIRHLIDLCADLGPNGVMVLGSPNQRNSTGGLTPAEAMRNFVEGIASVAQHAAVRGVRLLPEALPKAQSDIMQTMDEAYRVVHEIASPAVRMMFDFHNAVDEKEPHAVLVDRYFELIQHVHINEMDGRHPSTGKYDFKPVLAVLKKRQFQGWISLEVFDFKLGAQTIANESLRYLESEISKIE